MKVFKMNDYDWVAAENEKQAKEFYKEECGFDDDDINEEFVGEVSLKEEMLIEADDLPIEEQKQQQKTMTYGNVLWVYKSFGWVIAHEKIDKPRVICSTEY